MMPTGSGRRRRSIDRDVAAIDDRRDRRRVRRRTADAVLLERLDERRLGEARRRLREVLGRVGVADGRRPRPRRGRAGATPPRRRRRRRGLRCRRARSRRTSSAWRWRAARTARHRRSALVVSIRFSAICDASARCQMSRYSRSSSGLRTLASESGSRAKLVGPDRLVRLLGALASWSCMPRPLGQRVGIAVAPGDDVVGLLHRRARER